MNLHKKFDNMLATPIWEYSEEMVELLSKSSFGRYRLQHDYLSLRGEPSQELTDIKKVFKSESLASFCLSIKKRDYDLLNGMNEKFPYAGCEDQEFSMRAREKGYLLLLDENFKVKHNELDRIEIKKWLNRQFTGVQGFVYLATIFQSRKNSALWIENTPISLKQPIRITIKKIIKLFARQPISIWALMTIAQIGDKLNFPQRLQFKLYHFLTGVFINKGFTKSFYNNAHSTHNG